MAVDELVLVVVHPDLEDAHLLAALVALLQPPAQPLRQRLHPLLLLRAEFGVEPLPRRRTGNNSPGRRWRNRAQGGRGGLRRRPRRHRRGLDARARRASAQLEEHVRHRRSLLAVAVRRQGWPRQRRHRAVLVEIRAHWNCFFTKLIKFKIEACLGGPLELLLATTSMLFVGFKMEIEETEE